MFFMRFLLVFILFFETIYSQNTYPQDYFRLPLDIPISISGSFGELRYGHFHTGIDFRTEKREGLPVYASADGFISRIKISTGGYGKSIYIDHPNGFTTVYGHLQSAEGIIQDSILKQQYTQKKYEVEFFPKPTYLIVKKGDIIGYSGNTGGSGGPHLHFEIRETKTEMIINPLYFGFNQNLKDNTPPQILGILAYPIGENSQVNGSEKPIIVTLSLQKDGTYLATRVLASGTIGFGINTHDTSNFNYGKNGIFKLDTFLNGVPYFSYKFDSFSFDDAKYINNFIDYPLYQSQKQRFQKLFLGNFYPTNIIKTVKNNGLITVANNFTLIYKIVVQDFHNNISVINIPLAYFNAPVLKKNEFKKTPYFLKALNEHSYTKDGISVFIPEKTFFEDFYINFNVKDNQLTLHDESVAVQNSYTINFDVSAINLKEQEKMFIGNLDRGNLEYNNTFKKENTFTINTKKLGTFLLSKDSISPKIYKPNFKEGDNMDLVKQLKIYISDNLSGVKEINAYINGKWILMEYESKLNRLTHNFNDNIHIIGRNDFKIIVSDNLGNSTTFESYFLKTK